MWEAVLLSATRMLVEARLELVVVKRLLTMT